MKLLKYAFNYLKRNFLKTFLNALIIFVMTFVLFTSINVRNSQETLYHNMEISTPINYELGGYVTFIANADVIRYDDNSDYYETIISVIEGLKECEHLDGVIDSKITFSFNNYVNDLYDSALTVDIDGLIIGNSFALEEFENFDDYILEGENLDKDDEDTLNVLVSDEHFIDDSADIDYYYLEVGDELVFKREAGNSLDGYYPLSDYSFKVKGIFDKRALERDLGIEADVLALNSTALKYLKDYKDDRNTLSKEIVYKAIKEGSARGETSIRIPSATPNKNIFMIDQAVYNFKNAETVQDFDHRAEAIIDEKVQNEGNERLLSGIFFTAGSTTNDLDNIIEPFKALRNNLDSSILAILVFCVIMLIISSIYMINSRQKEMMIRSALGEKRKRQFLQYLIENSVISFITTTIAYILNITIISKVIEAMFKRSIETQNDLKRIATGELGAFDELYELSRYNILNIQITDYFITLLIILILVTIASLLSFFTQKKNDYRTFLNS